jgi:hypothetical protein
MAGDSQAVVNLASVLSAAVGIGAGIISYFASRFTAQSQLKRARLELNRRSTERLYEARLLAYPLAFEITDSLRGEYLFHAKPTHEGLGDVYNRLLDWNKRNGLILSEDAFGKYVRLRTALRATLDPATTLTKDVLNSLSEARRLFRGSLRRDLNLLFTEENDDLREPLDVPGHLASEHRGGLTPTKRRRRSR